MKKLLLTLMLAVVSSSAMAEWVEVAEDDEETLTAYVDPVTIRKSANKVKMWSLFDFKETQKPFLLPQYMSVKSQNEYNCKEEQTRTLYASYHAKNMGGGSVIYDDNIPENWSPVPPDSIDEELWKFACGVSQIPIKPKPKPVEQKQKAEKERKERIAAEVERLQKQQLEEEERERLRKKEAGAQAAFKHQLIDEYKAEILAKIKSRIVMPPDLPHDPVAEFDVTLLPGGEILDVKMRKSSGYITFDRAVERAIVLSRPLPLPPDPKLFPSFRYLSLKIHYLE